MKTSTLSHLLFALTTSLLSSPTAATTTIPSSILTFEFKFINSLAPSYRASNSSIKLIGYKKIHIPADELDDFNDHYEKNTQSWENIQNTHYDRKESVLRVYFPVKDGLIRHHDQVLEASEYGEIEGVKPEDLGGDCAVLGRKRTKDVTGVKGNVVKDGVIYLETANKPTHSHDNVYVYDFGVKVHHEHGHDGELKTRDGIDIRAVSCINNHGGPNCSNKFRIYGGRCPFQSRACMDFNGWFGNCVNASPSSKTGIKNFPGSDCFVAMSRGHCWNEIM